MRNPSKPMAALITAEVIFILIGGYILLFTNWPS